MSQENLSATQANPELSEEYKKQWPRNIDPENKKFPVWMIILDENTREFGVTTDKLLAKIMSNLGYRIFDETPFEYDDYEHFKQQKKLYVLPDGGGDSPEKVKDSMWVVQPRSGQKMEFDETGENPASTVQYKRESEALTMNAERRQQADKSTIQCIDASCMTLVGTLFFRLANKARRNLVLILMSHGRNWRSWLGNWNMTVCLGLILKR